MEVRVQSTIANSEDYYLASSLLLRLEADHFYSKILKRFQSSDVLICNMFGSLGGPALWSIPHVKECCVETI